MKRYIAATWDVYGEYGDHFSRLEDAKKCAQEVSMRTDQDYKASVWKDGTCYIDYENGKLVRDGWSLPSFKNTGTKAKFNLDGKIVEKLIWLDPEGNKVIKHNGKIYRVNV